MKQKLLFIAIAALGLASCQQDKSIDINKGNAIDFRVAMDTRATETKTENLEKIVVTALNAENQNFFTNVEFTKSNGFFTSTPAYYWPGDGSQLNFYAYAPAASDLVGATMTIDKTKKELKDFSPKDKIEEQIDFITAHATGTKDNETTGVALTFKHQLSQIEIKAKNSNTGYTYNVQGVRIGQAVSKGTFNFEETSVPEAKTSKWTPDSEKKNYEVTYAPETKAITLGTEAQSLMDDSNSAMLIPQQLTKWEADSDKTNTKKGAYLAVKVQITTKDGARVYPATAAGEYDWVAVPIETKWEAGKKYIYTLDFSAGAGRVDPEKKTDPATKDDNFQPGDKILGGAIKFTVKVTEWEEVKPTEDINMQ